MVTGGFYCERLAVQPPGTRRSAIVTSLKYASDLIIRRKSLAEVTWSLFSNKFTWSAQPDVLR